MGMLRFENGLTANIYASFRSEYRTWLEVLGTSGALTVPNPFRPGLLETLELERGGKVERIEVAGSPMIFVKEIEDFEARVLDGAAAVVTLTESRRTAATLSALYQSASTRTQAADPPTT
jgi:predicted dehydrogenase